MQIGRKIYYDKANGKVLVNTGERDGDVHEKTTQQDFPGYDPNLHGILQFAFGERENEFAIFGSMEVSNNQLIIHPHLSLALDKTQIHATGLDAAKLTVSVPDPQAVDTITVTVDGKAYNDNFVNGQAVFTFTCAVEGKYQFVVSSLKHGSGTAAVEVIT